MKKLTRILSLILMLSVVLVSCKKDDETSKIEMIKGTWGIGDNLTPVLTLNTSGTYIFVATRGNYTFTEGNPDKLTLTMQFSEEVPPVNITASVTTLTSKSMTLDFTGGLNDTYLGQLTAIFTDIDFSKPVVFNKLIDLSF